MRFLTYNVNNNSNAWFYRELNKHLINNQIDVLILQECFSDNYNIFQDSFEEIPDFIHESGRRWVRIFISRNSELSFHEPTSYGGDTDNRLRGVVLRTNSNFTINLLGVHMYSSVGKTEDQQLAKNRELVKHIKDFEQKQEHDRTIVAGDFNNTPYSKHLVQTDVFNSFNNRDFVEHHQSRRLNNQENTYFYNPMWNLLGDFDAIQETRKINGTYYWYPYDMNQLPWNLLDGVLIRPSIMNKLNLQTLEILTWLNGNSLLKDEVENNYETLLNPNYSDHLPVIFEIKSE